jgi:hypothetical protein
LQIVGGIVGIPQAQFAPWTRKHDKPGVPLIPQASNIIYPQSLEDLISICSNRPAKTHLHAAGSHWALSDAALSDQSFIETHDPNNLFPAMGRTLYEVVPGCLSDNFLTELNNEFPSGSPASTYCVHIESGKRIYQLYAELDVGDTAQNASLDAMMKARFNNTAFDGSWGFFTLGGAGGQTVVGALSTGTHGGDFDRPPVSDSVVALHLVADGGKHYWIERRLRKSATITDEQKLRALYGDAKYGGPENFEVIYDSNVLRAALVQVGRFGTVYSAVLEVTRQYGLEQEVKLDTWENVKGQIADPNSGLFSKGLLTADGTTIPQRFLQVVVNPVPLANLTTHQVGITRRWTVPLSAVPASPLPPANWSGTLNPAGRPELVGNLVNPMDPMLKAPGFSAAGQSVGYSPDDSGITSFNLLDAACADPSFIDGIVSGIYTEIGNFISDNAVEIGGGLAAAVAVGGPGLAALIPELLAILAILALFLEALRHSGPSTLGGAMNDLRGALLGSSDPAQRAAGIIVWSAIAGKVFASQQKEQTYSAISYAIMDTHNYQDVSCNVNVRSVEVFFDAADPNLIAFVDRLLKFQIDQEFAFGRSVVGYISLRFTGASSALIAPEPFTRTCAIECAALADVDGSTQFVDMATALALDPNINGILHWGQQNPSTQSDIEFRFGDTPSNPTGMLHAWRSVLALLTENGRLDGYTSAFTRRTGLEVVQPAIATFALTNPSAPPPGQYIVSWNCVNNPPGTTVRLQVQPPSGVMAPITRLPLSGSHTFNVANHGTYTVTLVADLTRNGITREATQALNFTY